MSRRKAETVAEPVDVEALRAELAKAHRRVGVLEAEIARRDGEAAEQAARPKPIARVLAACNTPAKRFSRGGDFLRFMASLRALGQQYIPGEASRAAMVGYVLAAAERAFEEVMTELAAADEAARVRP